MERFPVTVEAKCKNIDRIYPQKRRLAVELCAAAAKFDEIRRLIIFGSSVTASCTDSSDIDICVDADLSDGLRIYEIQRKLGDICGWNCDIVMYGTVGSALKETICSKGVTIYEQSA